MESNVRWKKEMKDRKKTGDIQPGHAERQKKNETVLNSGKFKSICSDLGIEPSRRQASKWNNGKGLAYKNRSLAN